MMGPIKLALLAAARLPSCYHWALGVAPPAIGRVLWRMAGWLVWFPSGQLGSESNKLWSVCLRIRTIVHISRFHLVRQIWYWPFFFALSLFTGTIFAVLSCGSFAVYYLAAAPKRACVQDLPILLF